MNLARPSPTRSGAVVIALLLGLGACTSNPSAKAVATDIVESLDTLDEGEQQCMLDKLDTYSADQLQALGDANLDVNFDLPDAVEHTTDDFQKFVDDLAECTAAG